MNENSNATPVKMPTGMKIVLAIFSFNLITLLIGFAQDNAGGMPLLGIDPKVFAGISLLVTVFYISAIYLRRWWKAVITLLAIGIVQGIITAGYMLSLSITDYYRIAGKDLPANISVAELESAGEMTKMLLAIPMAIAFVISILIFAYIWKRRSYFSEGGHS